MKTTKLNNSIMATVLVMLCAITIGSIVTTSNNNAEYGSRVPVQMLEKFSGQSEYYYKPAGDSRIWHIINNYSDINTSDNCRNMSYYIFNADSVLVINHYAGMQEQNNLDGSFTNLSD